MVPVKEDDPKLAKKHFETSELRLHIEMRKEGEEGRYKEHVLRFKRTFKEREKSAD